jgi:hypothetical protein
MTKPKPKLRLPPMNAYERTVLANVEKFGWHCTSVAPRSGEVGESFSYTVGLSQTFDSTELMVFGLASDVAHSIFSIFVDRLREGRPIPLDAPSDDLLKDYPCVFVPVPRPRYNDYVFSALWFYAEQEFQLHQLVYPDREGRFPWHAAAASDFRHQQPVLRHSSEA